MQPLGGAIRDELIARLGPRPSARRIAFALTIVGAALAVATIAVALLEGPPLGLPDASPVYFAAIVLVGSIAGTWPALIAAVSAFLVYDLLFTEPRFTLIVEDPREWLDLVLFLILAVIVGRLSALGTERAAEASRRAAEATGLFAVGRILATAPDVAEAAPAVAERLLEATGLERVWIVEERPGGQRLLADTQPGEPIPTSSFASNLVRTPGDAPARWQRSHEPMASGPGASSLGARASIRAPILRVRMEAEGQTTGAIRAVAAGPRAAEPDRSTTRLLALAADQLALAIRRDALRHEATELEIARRADDLKSALLDAVTHDLRTPLASIRASAGALLDREIPLDERAARAAGSAIDAEAERLDRLVREVLDLGRVDSGTLRPDLEAIDLADAVEAVVDRYRGALGERAIEIRMEDGLSPVHADAVLLDGLLANLVENVARHAPPPAAVRISARADGPRRVRLSVDDAGPGVAPADLGRLFDRFHRLPLAVEGSRRGLGLGLSIVRGFAEAMGGTVAAEPSPLGGLRVVVGLVGTPDPGAVARP